MSSATSLIATCLLFVCAGVTRDIKRSELSQTHTVTLFPDQAVFSDGQAELVIELYSRAEPPKDEAKSDGTQVRVSVRLSVCALAVWV